MNTQLFPVSMIFTALGLKFRRETYIAVCKHCGRVEIGDEAEFIDEHGICVMCEELRTVHQI